MRSHEKRLLDGKVRSRTDSHLPTPTRYIVRTREVPVSIDDKKCSGEFLTERITYVHAHHEVRREVGAPGSGVVEIVFCVEGIVSNKTAEDSALDCQTLTDRREVGNVRWPELT